MIKATFFDAHARNCYGLTDANGAGCLVEFFGPHRRVALLDYMLNHYIPRRAIRELLICYKRN